MNEHGRERGIVAVTFAELARLLNEQPGLDAVCQAICDAAPRLVPSVDHASIMLKEGERYRTIAASDEIGARVDQLERETGEGPCVDAIEGDEYTLEPDIAERTSWPKLTARVLAESPVRGVAGYRLVVGGRKKAALNLFSDTPGALDAEAADQGVVLAAFASVALGGTTSREEARTLAEGLQSNREIGTAIGLMMAAHGLSAEEAFETLRAASSRLNRKLAVIAREIVEQQASSGRA